MWCICGVGRLLWYAGVCVPIIKVSVSDRGVICQSVRGDRGGDRELDPAGQIKHAYMTI